MKQSSSLPVLPSTQLFALLLFLCAPTYVLAQTNCTPRPAGLVAWWPGDGFAVDVAGTSHGVLTNGAAYGAGKVGQAFRFDCPNDQFMRPI